MVSAIRYLADARPNQQGIKKCVNYVNRTPEARAGTQLHIAQR